MSELIRKFEIGDDTLTETDIAEIFVTLGDSGVFDEETGVVAWVSPRAFLKITYFSKYDPGGVWRVEPYWMHIRMKGGIRNKMLVEWAS